MELISPIITILGVWGLVWYSIQQNKILRQITPSEQPKALEYWVEDHRLVKTWMASSHENAPAAAAWAWKCSCGSRGVAGNVEQGKNLGSEANAIERFKQHAQGYRDANKGVINPLKTKLDKVEADFAEYREKCYCKHTNDDLILLERKQGHVQ